MKRLIIKVFFLGIYTIMYLNSTAQELVHGIDGFNSPTSLNNGSTINYSLGNAHSSDMFNGSYNIYIPIFSFENNYGNYGVGISYNTKGVKIDEVATEVGLHWNLVSGGTITRNIKDIPDDLYFNPIDPLYDTNGNKINTYVGKLYYNYNVLNRPNFTNSILDLEHDDFIVSFGNLSFSFNIGDEGYIFSHPKKNILIQFLNDTEILTINNFFISDPTKKTFKIKITDDEGIVYIFKPTTFINWIESRIFYRLSSEAPFNHDYGSFPIEWKIENVIFPDGNTISYKYIEDGVHSNVGGTYTFNTNSSFSIVRIDNINSSRHYLEKITYPNNISVQFKYVENTCTHTRKILDTIIVKEDKNALKYIFEHDIVASGPYTNIFNKRSECQPLSSLPTGFTQSDYYRLFLKEIKLLGFNNIGIETIHSFIYSNIKLPPHNSGYQDFFGYYNGNTASLSDNGKNLMPNLTKIEDSTLYTSGTSRYYNGTYAQAGLITEVHNAYGGYTKFEYEAHSGVSIPLPFTPLHTVENATNLLDGVRVKSIEYIDTKVPTQYNKIVFDYEGGQQFTPGINIVSPNKINNDSTISTYQYFSHITSPLFLVNNSNVGYSKITSRSYNYNNELLNKEITYFTNLDDYLSNANQKYLRLGPNKPFNALPIIGNQFIKDWEIGLQYRNEIYDHNNNILKVIEHEYRFELDTISTIGVLENKKSIWAKNIDTNYLYKRYIFDNYRPYSGNTFIEKTISKHFYSNSDSVIDVVEYAYNDRNKIKSITTTNSEGKKIITYNIYSSDIKTSVPTALDLNYPITLQVGMEKWIKNNAIDSNSIYLQESVIFIHEKTDSIIHKSRKNYISRFENQISDTVFTGYRYKNADFNSNRLNYIRNAYTTGLLPEGFEMVNYVDIYDTKNRPVEISTFNNTKTNAIIYDEISGNVLANVSNANYNQIGYTGFDEACITDTSIHLTSDVIIENGNFKYYGHGIIESYLDFASDYICGKSYALYKTDPFNPSSPVSKLEYNNILEYGQKYVLSFWSKNGVPLIEGIGLGIYTPISKYTIGSWTYYSVVLIPTTNTQLFLSDNGSNSIIIDEVRIHPFSAQMSTITYKALCGKIAEAGHDGRIMYYEYDDLGRLVIVRDQDGYILKKFERNNL